MKTFFRSLFIFSVLLPGIIYAQWTAPRNISPNAMHATMNENMGPCIASSHDTLHVIWSDHRVDGYAIYYTRSIDSGKTWSNAIPISDTMGSATMPSLAVNGKNIHVVWWDTVLGLACSSYKHSVDGGNTWSTTMIVDSNTVYWPGVAVAGSTVLISIDKKPASRTTVFLMKSTDNGMSFGPEQQISTPVAGVGRSEDQATATDGKNIFMCWNDNRNNPTELEIYYRRSRDMGSTWDPEIDVTDSSAYSPMIYVNNSNVNMLFGFKNPVNVWLSQSNDTGNTWAANRQITTNNVNGETQAYPSMVCDGQNLYMTTMLFPAAPWGVYFLQSSDGGNTWSSQVQLGTCNGTPFIALTCPEVHVVWPDNGAIYYAKNPTAAPSCPTNTAGISTISNNYPTFSIYPDPVTNQATVSFNEDGQHQLYIYDITGKKIAGFSCITEEFTFPSSSLQPGMYFIQSINQKESQTIKFIKQ